MKYCRFEFENQVYYGVVECRDGGAWIVDLASAPDEDHSFRLYHGESAALSHRFEPMPLKEAQLLPPVTPSKIVCVGRNYIDHAQELGSDVPSEPLIFLKPPSTLLPPRGEIRMPTISQRVDYEGELALVIGRRTRNLKQEKWRSAVRGYTLANDVTARDLQKKDDQWTRAKGFDTFCPVGPFVSDEIDPEAGLLLETRVNGEVRQQGATKDFIFSIPVLLEWISSIFTLEAGDLILTGTPAGVGPLSVGDHVEVAIKGLGVLSNTVVADASA